MSEYEGYVIEQDGTFSMVSIRSKGKGAIPKELRGKYTNTNFAQKAIDSYGKRRKEEEGGETKRSD